MELIKPPTNYYDIDAAATHLNATVGELLRWGADGKLKFSIRLKPSRLVTSIGLDCSSCGSIENVPEYSETYEISINTLKDVWGDEQAKFHPILVCSNCQHDLQVTYNLDAYHPCFDEDKTDTENGVNDLLVSDDNFTKFKSIYFAVRDEGKIPTAQEGRQPEDQVREKVVAQKKLRTPIRRPGVRSRLTVTLENARALLIGENKKEPTCRQVKDFLKFEDPLGCVKDYGKDEKGAFLGWEDNSGKYHKIRDKSIANKLTKIRNESNRL